MLGTKRRVRAEAISITITSISRSACNGCLSKIDSNEVVLALRHILKASGYEDFCCCRCHLDIDGVARFPEHLQSRSVRDLGTVPDCRCWHDLLDFSSASCEADNSQGSWQGSLYRCEGRG